MIETKINESIYCLNDILENLKLVYNSDIDTTSFQAGMIEGKIVAYSRALKMFEELIKE